MIWIFALAAWVSAFPLADQFEARHCRNFKVSTGGEQKADGILRHCDDGKDQLVYLSGELDTRSDRRSLKSVIQRIQKRFSGRFQVVTKYAGGGEVEWHQDLMVAVEDSCLGACRIDTRVMGHCDSACNQLHLTCAQGATTLVERDGQLCEHASTGEIGDPDCTKCDPFDPKNCQICGAEESIYEYTERCDEMLKGRNIKIDPAKKKMVETYANRLGELGVFDTLNLTCIRPPWAISAPESSVVFLK